MQSAETFVRAGTAAAGAASGAAANTAAAWSMAIFGAPLAVLFAAFSGALVSLTFLPASSIARSLVVLFSGTLAGVYTSSLVAEWWRFSDAATGGCAFVVGAALQWAVPEFLDRMRRKK